MLQELCGTYAVAVWVVPFSRLAMSRDMVMRIRWRSAWIDFAPTYNAQSEVMCLVLDEADRMLDMGRSPVGGLEKVVASICARAVESVILLALLILTRCACSAPFQDSGCLRLE